MAQKPGPENVSPILEQGFEAITPAIANMVRTTRRLLMRDSSVGDQIPLELWACNERGDAELTVVWGAAISDVVMSIGASSETKGREAAARIAHMEDPLYITYTAKNMLGVLRSVGVFVDGDSSMLAENGDPVNEATFAKIHSSDADFFTIAQQGLKDMTRRRRVQREARAMSLMPSIGRSNPLSSEELPHALETPYPNKIDTLRRALNRADLLPKWHIRISNEADINLSRPFLLDRPGENLPRPAFIGYSSNRRGTYPSIVYLDNRGAWRLLTERYAKKDWYDINASLPSTTPAFQLQSEFSEVYRVSRNTHVDMSLDGIAQRVVVDALIPSKNPRSLNSWRERVKYLDAREITVDMSAGNKTLPNLDKQGLKAQYKLPLPEYGFKTATMKVVSSGDGAFYYTFAECCGNSWLVSVDSVLDPIRLPAGCRNVDVRVFDETPGTTTTIWDNFSMLSGGHPLLLKGIRQLSH